MIKFERLSRRWKTTNVCDKCQYEECSRCNGGGSSSLDYQSNGTFHDETVENIYINPLHVQEIRTQNDLYGGGKTVIVLNENLYYETDEEIEKVVVKFGKFKYLFD